MRRNMTCSKRFFCVLACAAVMFLLNPGSASAAWSLVLTSEPLGRGDMFRLNKTQQRDHYQVYRGVASYASFDLSGLGYTGDAVLIRIKATDTMPEHFNLISTSMRWAGTERATLYIISQTFRRLNEWQFIGYENWYPLDMGTRSISIEINSGGFDDWNP